MSNRFSRKRITLACTLIVIFALGLVFGMRLAHSPGRAMVLDTQDPPASVMRQGDKIVIPPGSALRNQLIVQQVVVKDDPHVLTLPASVEADPARTVNILPPVAGRVVALPVRLGDRVVKAKRLS